MSRARKKKTNEAPINSAVIYARYSSNNQREEMDCQPLFVQKLFRQNSVTIIHGRQVI